MVLDCKPEWNREAVTVFSRLPSLMAANKHALNYNLPYLRYNKSSIAIAISVKIDRLPENESCKLIG